MVLLWGAHMAMTPTFLRIRSEAVDDRGMPRGPRLPGREAEAKGRYVMRLAKH